MFFSLQNLMPAYIPQAKAWSLGGKIDKPPIINRILIVFRCIQCYKIPGLALFFNDPVRLRNRTYWDFR